MGAIINEKQFRKVLGQSCGGVKQSGVGREFSLEGMLDSFAQKKSVTVNLGVPAPMTVAG